MTTLSVSDALSNRPEHIKEAALAIGRSQLRLAVFQAAYYHKQTVKSVAEIVAKTGLSRMKVLQSGGALVKANILGQAKKDGDTAYVQIPFFQRNKAQILSLVRNPEKLDAFVTKREPAMSFERPKAVARRRRQSSAVNRGVSTQRKDLRVAFLATNPDERASLRTDIEAREVLQAVQRSTHRDKVAIRHFPAARPSDLLDALNEFKPNVVHFSGHGGNKELLFDRNTALYNGGVSLDFPVMARALAAVDSPPQIAVLNACDTLRGAEVLLDAVEIVIAMSSKILDISATVFSATFYKALAESQSVASALKQGQVGIEMAKLGDADLPTMLAREGVDPSTCVLVK